MPSVKVPARKVGAAVRTAVVKRIERSRLDQVLVAQARRRINNKGDSEHRYPDLWASKTGLGYRSGGQPLRDVGTLFNALNGDTERSGNRIIIRLRDGTPGGYGIFHQDGFKSKGPNFIPLTRKAVRKHVKGNNPKDEGLVKGVDYVMAWKGVTVPQRKIFNSPPEDLEEMRDIMATSIGGK